MIGFDYTARIDPAALQAAGCAAAIRYVMPQTAYWTKTLRNAEAAELLAAGLPIVSNYETTADRMKGAASAGHADAVDLLANWRALGAPSGLIGWFSADWDVQPSEVSAVLDYLHAAADALGGKRFVGLYGGLRACAAAADAGFAIWQTVAWSGGRWDPRTVARQTGEQRIVGGVQVDVNEISNLAALGGWTSEGTAMGNFTMSAGWQNDYSDVAAALQKHIPAGTVVDEAAAAGYSMVRSFVAAERAAVIEDLLRQLLARPAVVTATVDVAALAAAIGPVVNSGATADEVASAVVAHLAEQLVKP